MIIFAPAKATRASTSASTVRSATKHLISCQSRQWPRALSGLCRLTEGRATTLTTLTTLAARWQEAGRLLERTATVSGKALSSAARSSMRSVVEVITTVLHTLASRLQRRRRRVRSVHAGQEFQAELASHRKQRGQAATHRAQAKPMAVGPPQPVTSAICSPMGWSAMIDMGGYNGAGTVRACGRRLGLGQ